MLNFERIRSEFKDVLETEAHNVTMRVETAAGDVGQEVLGMLSSAADNPLKQLGLFNETFDGAINDLLDNEQFARMANAIDADEPLAQYLNVFGDHPAVQQLGELWSAVRDSEGEAAQMQRAFDDVTDRFAVSASTQQALSIIIAHAKRRAPATPSSSDREARRRNRNNTDSQGDDGNNGDAVQMRGGKSSQRPAAVKRIASAGVRGVGSSLPHADRVQRSFGRHDISAVRAHVGTDAARAAERLGADAYATGDNVAFRRTPDLFTTAHEAAHVVQQRAGRIPSSGVGARGDEFERHADSVAEAVVRGRSAEPLLDRFAARGAVAQTAVQRSDDEEADTSGAAGRAREIKSCLLDGWTEDEEGALDQIRGQSTPMIRAIRSSYLSITGGRKLERDFKEYCNESQSNEALALIWPTMSVLDKLRANINEGWLWNTENEQGMIDVLRTAEKSELRRYLRSIRRIIEDAMSDDELYDAYQILADPEIDTRGEIRYESTVKRIEDAEGWVNDDEGAVYDALMKLPVAMRRRFWREHGSSDLLDFFNSRERNSVRIICTGSQAEALQERMRIATDGAGTDEDGVELVAEIAGTAVQRQRQIQQMLESGNNEEGQPLNEQARGRLEAELEELGNVSGLLEIQRDDDGEVRSNTFLGMMKDDVSDAEFQRYAATMRVDDYERAKQQIIDAIGFFNDDEESIYSAFELVQDAEMRRRLMQDPDVRSLLNEHLNDEERDTASAFSEGDSYEMAEHRIREAHEGINTEEQEVMRLIANLSQADRERFATSSLWTTIQGSWAYNAREKELLQELVRTGRMPTEEALNYALGREVQRTSHGPHGHGGTYTVVEGGEGGSEALEIFIGQLTAEERREYRLGYFLTRNGGANTPEQEALVAAYQDLEQRMQRRLGTDDTQKYVEQILGPPTPEDMQSPEGLQMAAAIMYHRIQDKQALQGSLADGFTETDETADMAGVQFMALYRQATEDGQLTANELAALGALYNQYSGRYDEYVNSVDMVANIAGMVAAIAVGIVVTALTGGAAGPLVGAALAKAMVTGAVAGAVARVGASELMGGDHYEATGEEGRLDALAGAVDGAMAVLSAGLASRFTEMVGLSRQALTANITARTINSTRGAMQYTGRRLISNGVESAVDGFISGAVAELVLTAADRATWEGSIWNAVTNMGMAMLRGGLIGAGTGAAVGGAMGAGTDALQIRRVRQIADDLGVPPDRFMNLHPEAVDELGRAMKAMCDGNDAHAQRAFDAIERNEWMTPDEIARLRGEMGDSLTRQRAFETADEVAAARDADLVTRLDALGDEPAVVDSIIVGEGWAGTADAATHPLRNQTGDNGLPRVIGVAEAGDPWRGRVERMGQTADELEVPGMRAQASDFTSDADEFAPAQAFGAAVAQTRAEAGVPTLRGRITEVVPAGPDAPARYKVTVGDRVIYTNQIDLAIGPGPARGLDSPGVDDAQRIIRQADEARLKEAGVLQAGEDALADQDAASEVLVYGGGATGAWNAEHAFNEGADVDWVGAGFGRRRAEVTEIDYQLRDPDLDPDARQALLSRRNEIMETQRGHDPFAAANVPRNEATLNNPEITRSRNEIFRIEPVEVDGQLKARVTFADGSEKIYDRVVTAVGQNPGAEGGSLKLISQLAEGADGPVIRPIFDDSGALLGVQTTDGGVRLIGAANAPEQLAKYMSPEDGQAFLEGLNRRINENPNVGENSRGINMAVANWADTPSALNAQVVADNPLGAHLDDVLRSPQAQQRLHGLANEALDDVTGRLRGLDLPPGAEVLTNMKGSDDLEAFMAAVTEKVQRKSYDTVGDMGDMVRGRISLDSGDDMDSIIAQIEEAFPGAQIDRKPDSPYPRTHVDLTAENGVRFELQIGTKATNQFLETRAVHLPQVLADKVGKVDVDFHVAKYDVLDKLDDARRAQYNMDELDEAYNRALRATGTGEFDAAAHQEMVDRLQHILDDLAQNDPDYLTSLYTKGGPEAATPTTATAGTHDAPTHDGGGTTTTTTGTGPDTTVDPLGSTLEDVLANPAAQTRLHGLANEALDSVTGKLNGFDLPPGAEVLTNMKGADDLEAFMAAVTEKVTRKGYDTVGDMGDMVRGRISLDSGDDMDSIIAQVQEAFPSAVIDRKPDSPYPRTHVDLTADNGVRFELQIGTKATNQFLETRAVHLPQVLADKVGKVDVDFHVAKYDVLDKLDDARRAQYNMDELDELYNRALRATGSGEFDADAHQEMVDRLQHILDDLAEREPDYLTSLYTKASHAPAAAAHANPIAMSLDTLLADEAAQVRLFEQASDALDSMNARLGGLEGLSANAEIVTSLKREDLDGFIAAVQEKVTRKGYDTVGEMGDMIRGRVNVDSGDEMDSVIEQLQRMFPDADFDLKEDIPYPRVHVDVPHESGVRFELQIGTHSTTQFLETRGIELPAPLAQKVGMTNVDFHVAKYDVLDKMDDAHRARYNMDELDATYNQALAATRTGEFDAEGYQDLTRRVKEILDSMATEEPDYLRGLYTKGGHSTVPHGTPGGQNAMLAPEADISGGVGRTANYYAAKFAVMGLRSGTKKVIKTEVKEEINHNEGEHLSEEERRRLEEEGGH